MCSYFLVSNILHFIFHFLDYRLLFFSQDAITSLDQSPTQRSILYVNLTIILSLAVFFYVYFCISPFTKVISHYYFFQSIVSYLNFFRTRLTN